MAVRDRFDPTLIVRLPPAWLLPRNSTADSVVARQRMHGIVVEEFTAGFTVAGELFSIDSVIRPARPFQGHSEVRVEGRWNPAARIVAERGSFIVRATQPLGVLAAVLLEPPSDDGFVIWNVLDQALAGAMAAPGSHDYPFVHLAAPIAAPTRILP